jgi:hypothetical protein
VAQDMAEPRFEDGTGYFVRKVDLQFLCIGEKSYVAFRQQSRPLGCNEKQWDQFKRNLKIAIKNDGIGQVDVRLQGSAAKFFSGHHKPMPYERRDIVLAFLQAHRRAPRKQELDGVIRRLSNIWPEGEPRPGRRPFDALHRLEVAPSPSDIDVQISSDEIVDRAAALIKNLGLSADEVLVKHEKYSFVRKEWLDHVCPHVTSWALRQSDILSRSVTVAAFPSAGPPRVQGPLSSHHKPDDWTVPLQGGA